jgi:acetyltransferase-like isoleucine patch superfamily enzyme
MGITIGTVHPTSIVEDPASLSDGVKVWHRAHIRAGARLGRNTVVGSGVYIDTDVHVGANCKIQNGALIYSGTTIEDGVFIGPGVITANDLYPRAINPDGSLKSATEWTVSPTVIGYGASLGAGVVVCPGVTVGEWALVAAGAVVSNDLAPHQLVAGVPARAIGQVCECGRRSAERCEQCGWPSNE